MADSRPDTPRSIERTPVPPPGGGDGGIRVDWKAIGLRRTTQREIVFGLVQSSVEHPTAEWIHQEARQILPDISLATVYRTLRSLKERGLVQEFSGGSTSSRYDGAGRDHEHVRCIRCGVVEDVTIPELGDLRDRIAERTGFRIGSHPFLFQGICESCARFVEDDGGDSRPPASERDALS